jgi:Flp pilus assembly pilin Flp
MQTIVRRSEDATRELAIHAKVALDNLLYAIAERTREQRGQTAAEYMGILLIVAVIIGALYTSNLGHKISTLVGQLIDSINSGNKQGPGGN